MQPKLSQKELKKIQTSAVRAARAGGEVLMHYFSRKLKVMRKPGAGLVTQADLLAEKKVIQILKKDFPDFSFLAEESKKPKKKTQGRWIIDPLDGTTNFVHGFHMFCVSIAAEWNGEIVCGVIFHPPLKDLYVGVKGKGATLNGKKIRVSSTKRISDALLTTGFAYQRSQRFSKEISTFERVSKSALATRRPGSAALDLAYTARGVFDGFWERGLSAWDVAAGSLIVEEAGGRVSNFSGGTFDVELDEIVATNSQLHPSILRAIKR